MARLDASLTQGLMNPTYAGELRNVGATAGMLGGQMRKERRAQEQAQKMAGMDAAGVLAENRAIAKSPEQATAAALAQDQFGAMQEKRANAAEDRKVAERARKQEKAEKFASSRLSGMGKRYDALVREGETEKADALFTQMEEIANGAMIEVGNFVSEAPSEAGRYMNVGGGSIFDTKTGEYITNPTDAQKDSAGPELAPKDFLSNIRQLQTDKAKWTPEAFQDFLTDIQSEGVYGSAAKHLTRENQVNLGEETVKAERTQVDNARAKLSTINKILDRVVKYGDSQGINILKGTTQSIASILPGSDAKAVYDENESLEADAAFGELTRMREASKTGGALGSITEKELSLLQSKVASLKPSNPEYINNLMYLQSMYQQVIDMAEGPEGGSDNFASPSLYISPLTGKGYDFDGKLTGTVGEELPDDMTNAILAELGY